MDIERIHQYHKAKNLGYEQRDSIREFPKKPAACYNILEIFIVLLEILFASHQQRQIEIVDTFEILKELNKLVERDDAQVLHGDPIDIRLDIVDVQHYKEDSHRKQSSKATPEVRLQ